ncbi:transcriptional regulator [Arthrobacter sp. SW1]|uniref:SRPBCC family protein n=1 Tax=Arthrobacter sp. SW1 TaxID=1920889 RepID=UPI000877B15D|nr:SRPBCC family protein [Arthrobacter sp. SW1]OFI38794.1 transcriptional regulator [Arthrobacter sp. SW1]
MSTFTVSRSALIPAPPSAIFPLVNDFHEWTKWSPWEAMDPNLSRSYSGPESGVGAKYEWTGNNKVGSGNMEIVGSDEPSRVRIRLEFIKPFKGVNPTVFTFVPEGGATRVTWAMTGENKTLLSKLFSLVMNMDKMVGKDFEKGLASLSVEAVKRKS